MRRVLITVVVLSVGLAAAACVFVAVEVNRPPALSSNEPVLFAIEAGESFSSVKDRLHRLGFVRRPTALATYALVFGYDRQIKAGTYQLLPDERPREVIEKFVEGDVYTVTVTIPEGYMFGEIAGAIARGTNIDSVAFGALVDDSDLIGRLGVDGPSLEGYLFPDTYTIPWGSEPEEVVAMMTERLGEVYDERADRRANALGFSRHEVLTLASIVQAETRLPDELTLVSAVYHNRLERGMKLEADPTVAYAKGGYRGRLFYKDLEIESPYNTYKNTGLPPGPICSPGAAAIHATLYPDSTSDALYFVAKGTGGHIFSRTLSDHLAAVRRVRESKGGGVGR